mmetsp:Transcript_27348/g.40249  ORF Transcript_27348/g.40249 Transcript_27348/m.40249 type:complete len:205 (+) Transcript_27348:3-617(+)
MHFRSQSLFRSHSLSLISVSLLLRYFFPLSLSLPLFLSLTLSLTHSLCLSLSLSLFFLPLFLPLPLALSLSLALCKTYTCVCPCVCARCLLQARDTRTAVQPLTLCDTGKWRSWCCQRQRQDPRRQEHTECLPPCTAARVVQQVHLGLLAGRHPALPPHAHPRPRLRPATRAASAGRSMPQGYFPLLAGRARRRGRGKSGPSLM